MPAPILVPKISATPCHGVIRLWLSPLVSFEGLTESSTFRLLLFNILSCRCLWLFPAITSVVSIAGKVLGPNRLVLAHRGVYFGSEDVQPLAQQVLRNGQCWQQTNHIAVDTTGQN